jgi:hypothetical protein
VLQKQRIRCDTSSGGRTGYTEEESTHARTSCLILSLTGAAVAAVLLTAVPVQAAAAPATTVPETTVPETTVPATTVPATTAPVAMSSTIVLPLFGVPLTIGLIRNETGALTEVNLGPAEGFTATEVSPRRVALVPRPAHLRQDRDGGPH